MPAWDANAVHVRPSVTRIYLLQSAGEPGIFGPGGVGFEDVAMMLLVVVDPVVVIVVALASPEIPTQYASPSQ